jgi:hypothetical protein
MSKEKNEEYSLPCVYLVNNKGIQYYYSRENVGHFGVPKIIVPMGKFAPILDMDGKFGMCEVAFGVPVSNEQEADMLMNLFLNSDKFQNALNACKWKIFQIDYKLFKFLNVV